MFEKAAINPELVQSIEQVYLLRNIATQFFVDQSVQELIVQTSIERARLSVALVDVLKRSNRLGKILILSQLTQVLEQIHQSFQLHTPYELCFLDGTLQLKEINLLSYNNFFKIIGYDNRNVAEFLAQFDLIISDDLDDKKNEIFRRKLQHYPNWLLKVSVPSSENLIIA